MIRGVYETVLYTDDLAAAAAFYKEILGLRPVKPTSELVAAFRLPDGGMGGPGGMLLIFDRTQAGKPGREVPSHGTEGPGHVAFRIDRGEYDRWILRFRSSNVPIEKEIAWGTGARSIYVRDRDRNSVELVEGEIWPD